MPVVQVAVTLIVVGVLLWLVNTYIPMARSIKSILNAVIVIVVVVWLLNVFGLLGPIRSFRVGGPDLFDGNGQVATESGGNNPQAS